MGIYRTEHFEMTPWSSDGFKIGQYLQLEPQNLTIQYDEPPVHFRADDLIREQRM